ncbi:sensor histidine kinase [Paenibacillus humicola]|uniref:sensor histidine kinase n=1 Tax=Paenibacillus humicola TaxID=3110540 RepID=UPI00237A7335|nr:HAMP domain-containing sensor histidine kinase [Paenibacillus humicola]
MAETLRSFRFRMVLYFALSMLCSAVVTYALYRLLQLYYHTTKQESPLAKVRYFIRDIGDLNFFLIVFIPLSVLFFFLFTRRYVAYFRAISAGINRLAGGDFHHQVSIPSGDEFGDIARDINLAGAKLRQALERGDFAENSKERLVLNLAHDLRTPLTSVLGYLDFILQNDKLSAGQINHYAGIAYAKSQRLERLIDELFEITRMNYGQAPIERREIDLSGLLHQLNEELVPLFEKRHVETRLDLAPHAVVQGEGELLARVFENLLTNAARYGKDGKFIDIVCTLEEETVVVQVINYGDSISPEELPHIFDMFYTGDKARAHRDDSTGLGLFIAKNIVTQHEGTITADSSVIRTVFEVRLPRGEKRPERNEN